MDGMERIARARQLSHTICKKDLFIRWKVRVGITLTTIGILVAAMNGLVIDSILQSNMALSPKSMSYPMWKDLPEPLINSMYLFNVTNAEDVYKNGAKPKLQEVGPYVFHEYHHKFDETWNDNNTVTYKQRNKWIPVKGNLDDKVTILNIPIASMGAMVEHLPSATKKMINVGLSFLANEKLFVTKTAREILFDGYKDPLLDAADILKDFGIHMEGLTSKFGFFFGKNNTWYDNGIVNIHTTLAKLGRIHTLNYTTHNNFYPGQCGQYQGSPDMSPPYLQGTPKQYIFNPDLGRTMVLSLTDTNVGVHGIKGYEYKLDKSFFANSTYNRENFCFEHGNPLPNGVFNASAVRFKAPIYMSQPHFFQADPYYSSFLEKGSLHPNQAKHETAFVYEPTSGVAMKLTARFQVNIKLDQIPEISFFKNVPKLTYFPTVWFEEHFELPKVMVNQMWWLSYLGIILICMGAILIAFGITMFIYDLCVYHALTSKARYENLERNNGEEGNNQSSHEQNDLIDTERGENSHDGEVGNEN